MTLEKIKVSNFRLLKDFELDLKEELSLIIGKNNCGKTSTLIILEKMLNASKIVWEDISLSEQENLYNQINSTGTQGGIESIKLQLFIKYSEKDSYVNIKPLIMDLDPDNDMLVLEFVSSVNKNKLIFLRKVLDNKEIKSFENFSKFMKKNYSEYFKVERYSRGYNPETEEVTEEISDVLDKKDVDKVIKIVGIRADRAVSNDERNKALSSLSEKYYNSLKMEEDNEVLKELEKTIDRTDKEFNKIYNGDSDKKTGIFTNIIKIINEYGIANENIDISIQSSISEKNLLTNNTSLYYKQGENSLLPESYNGLGYLNLIGMFLEVETKLTDINSSPAEINILYIEEPEAHTHPQLQYIFIRNIKKHIQSHREELIKKNKDLQVMMTSHSSHIVSECDFSDIIYLKKVEKNIEAKSFCSLRERYNQNQTKEFKFIKQYLTLNRCELFFADKIICIEGDTERILMPSMMKKVDEKKVKDGISLLSQNISIIETGAHAFVFKHLFDFLGSKVLIITDIDSTRKYDDKKRPEACRPSEGKYTSNATIKEFFKGKIPKDETQFEYLINKEESEKVIGNTRIAYQIPEGKDEYQARSFEDAFIALNKAFVFKNKNEFSTYGALKNIGKLDSDIDPYNFAENNIDKKSAFASSILFFDGAEGIEWKVPKYIEEGLLWLQSN